MQDFAGPSKVGIITERGKSSNSWWLCQIKNARVDRINEQLKGCLLMQLEEHANQPKQLKIWVFGQMLAIYMLFMIGYAIYFRSVGWCVEWMVFTTLKKNQTCIYIYSEVGMIQGWVYFHLLDPFGSNIPMMFGLVVPAMAANESCQCWSMEKIWLVLGTKCSIPLAWMVNTFGFSLICVESIQW